ncbi:probable nucleoside diphosphate kinase 5 [Olea europaea subsp. europaea]|uniref:Nucleoside diphosphate kinase n=1 Tax=Olea europaea subsp. europaea TaxID=158383 RepID=A0A8S0S0K0_OLEEU|nr:probable nucleoside diphosphate kinase 5 [Olea europaea subsp. europaea]
MDLQFIRLFSRFLFLCLLVSTLRLPHRIWANVSTEKEKTLAMIKPDGVAGNYSDVIKTAIFYSGFSITQEMLLELNEETVRSFYAEHATKSFFPSLVQYMSSGPVLIMVLEKVNAISDWRNLIGPTDANKAKVTHPNSIRAMCGLDLQRNCVHGSDSPQSAYREITFFFNKSSSGQTFIST